MTIKELQLGNLVLIDGKIRKVSLLTGQKVGYYVDNHHNMKTISINNVAPIPVTEKMKENNPYMNEIDFPNVHQYQNMGTLLGKEIEVVF